jgi:hypothetical protein
MRRKSIKNNNNSNINSIYKKRQTESGFYIYIITLVIAYKSFLKKLICYRIVYVVTIFIDMHDASEVCAYF